MQSNCITSCMWKTKITDS